MQESELIAKYNINIESLKAEQLKLSKEITLKDSQDFTNIERIAAVENIIIKNQIISVVIVCDKEFNIIEQQYFLDKLRFPYLNEFRAYRELPTMVEAINKLTESPDIVLIRGEGIMHPRLGMASHLSLSVGIPVIGIADSIFDGSEVSGEDIVKDKKKVGRILQSKEKSNPLFINPGNKISIETSFNLIKNMIKLPHKLPEPLHLAHKYAKEVREELKL